MAGLLNLVPRYLPRYGMAPQWARAVRPLVLVFTAIAFLITLVFQANVDAQGGAYATGVLVLITSASRRGDALGAAQAAAQAHGRIRRSSPSIFVYTTIDNIIERPDGLRIAALFILGILVVSIVSRVGRSFQLRATSVTLDATALDFVLEDAEEGEIRIIAHEPDVGHDHRVLAEEQGRAEVQPHPAAVAHHLPRGDDTSDSSDFEEDLLVRGVVKHGYRVLQVKSGNVPNTIAAVLLEIRDITGVVPTIYFEWTEGNPISNMFRYLITGVGRGRPGDPRGAARGREGHQAPPRRARVLSALRPERPRVCRVRLVRAQPHS